MSFLNFIREVGELGYGTMVNIFFWKFKELGFVYGFVICELYDLE